MKTFKTYRNGNVRGVNEKNANDVHLQRKRIVASLNLCFRCINVGKMHQCIDASSVRLGQSVKCAFFIPTSFTCTAQESPSPCHGLIASNYPVPFIVGHCADSLDTVTLSSATSTAPGTQTQHLIWLTPFHSSYTVVRGFSPFVGRMNKSLENRNAHSFDRYLENTVFVFL